MKLTKEKIKQKIKQFEGLLEKETSEARRAVLEKEIAAYKAMKGTDSK